MTHMAGYTKGRCNSIRISFANRDDAQAFGACVRRVPRRHGSTLTAHIVGAWTSSLPARREAAGEAAATGSALGGLSRAWRAARGLVLEQPHRNLLAEASVRDGISELGRLVGPRDVNQIVVQNPPEVVLRRTKECLLLDAAVGAGALQVTKCLLEFHNAKPTRETLKMAISSGSLELIRLMRERLPIKPESRLDLLEVGGLPS